MGQWLDSITDQLTVNPQYCSVFSLYLTYPAQCCGLRINSSQRSQLEHIEVARDPMRGRAWTYQI